MNDPTSSRPPAWYMFAAIPALLFMALGCAVYLMHVLADPATMPLDQRAALEAEPAWVTAAYAIAVWAGLTGTLLLVMRRKLAEPILLVSLIAVLAWTAALLLVARLRETVSANDVAVAIAFAAITWTIFWFGRRSRQQGWLE